MEKHALALYDLIREINSRLVDCYVDLTISSFSEEVIVTKHFHPNTGRKPQHFVQAIDDELDLRILLSEIDN